MRTTLEQRIFLVSQMRADLFIKQSKLDNIVDSIKDKEQKQKIEMELEAVNLSLRAFELLKEELIDEQMRRRYEREERRQRQQERELRGIGNNNS